MRKFAVIAVLVVIAIPVALLGAAFVFREGLLRVGLHSVLAGSQISLSTLQGLHLHKDHAILDELGIVLPSGLRLDLSAIEVNYRFVSLRKLPAHTSVVIASAQLRESAAVITGQADEDTGAAHSSPVLLSEILALLREFPLASIDIDSLAVLQRREPLSLSLQHGAGTIQAQIVSGALRLGAQFSQSDATATAQLQLDLIRNAETVGTVLLSLTPEQQAYQLDGSGHVAIADMYALLDELQQGAMQLPLTGVNLDWTLAGTLADDLSGKLPASDASGTVETFVLTLQQGAALTLPAQLTPGLGELTLQLSDVADITFSTGTGIGIGIGIGIKSAHAPLVANSTWQDERISTDAVLTLADCAFTTTAACYIGFNGTARYAAYALAGNIAVEAPGLAIAPGSYRIQTANLALEGFDTWLPAFDVDATITLTPELISFSSPLLLQGAAGDAGLRLTGNYVRASGAADLQLSLPSLSFAETGTSLSALLPGWPYALDLLSGTLAADLSMHWQPDPGPAKAGRMSATLTGTLIEVGGYYADYFFRGASTALEASVDYASSTDTLVFATAPLSLTIAGIDVGVPIENLSVQGQMDRDSQQIRVASLYAETLDGVISANDVNYDFKRERNELVLQFAALDLERLLALVDYDGVQATGKISGELPVTLTDAGIEVAAGALTADASGGSIRYLKAAEAGLQGNAGLDLVNQALGNYQFSSMTSSIDYSPEGELVLTMQLTGHNPDIGADQPINLNLTVTDNIPALMKSLQAARAIEDFLELKYQ